MRKPLTDREGNPHDRDCPSRQVLDRIGDRWTVLIVDALSSGEVRFGELSKRVDGISQKMLTQTLRGLERDGIVQRTVYAEVPPRVDYRLTALGHSLRGPVNALVGWASTNIDAINSARAAFDAR